MSANDRHKQLTHQLARLGLGSDPGLGRGEEAFTSTAEVDDGLLGDTLSDVDGVTQTSNTCSSATVYLG